MQRKARLVATRGILDGLKGMLGGGSDGQGAGKQQAGWGEGADVEGSEEEEEGNTMVVLDPNERRGIGAEEAFGPLAVLLVGFLPEDYAGFQNLMKEMEADMIKVIPCTKAMMSGTLKAALELDKVPAYEQPPLGQRRALVLSGMYSSELIDVVSSYKEFGLPPAVFAAAVPNNYERQVSGIVEEVYADHNAMQQRMAQRAAEAQQE